MKKLLFFLTLVLTLSSCGSKNQQPTNKNGNETNITENTKTLISFDLNGGYTNSSTASKYVDSIKAEDFFFDVTKENYNFRGWSYKNEKVFDQKGVQLSNPTLEKEMTFTAEFAQTAQLTIVKNYEAAGSISGEGEYPYNTSVNISATVNQGYSFDGWYFNNTKLSSLTSYNYMMWSDDITLEARYKINNYKLSVNVQHEDLGQVMIKDVNTEFQSSASSNIPYLNNVTVAAYTKTEFTFLGWFNNNNELVETNGVYSFVMPNCDYELTARWNTPLLNVDISKNYENAGTVTGKGQYQQGDKVILSATTNAGYIFNGWYQSNTKIASSENYSFVMSDLSQIFEAKWDLIEYTITYNLNGGTNDLSNPTKYTIESPTISLKNPIKTGYSFTEWTLNGTKITSINKGTYGDLVLIACWSVNSYEVKVTTDSNKGQVFGSGYYNYGSQVTIRAIPKTGYEFEGWYQLNAKISSSENYSFTMPASSQTFEARWTLVEYTITYNLNGGINNSSNPIKYNIETATIILANPTYNHKTFEYWVNESGSKVTQIAKGSTGNIILTAIWSQTVEQEAEANWETHFANPILSRDGKIIQYGMYPQSKVTDLVLLSTLNSRAGKLPTQSYSGYWSPYNFYIEYSATTKFMWYIDIDLDSDGYKDYRGVYFTSYRPRNTQYSSSTVYSYQDDNGYKINNYYWFKYEPIDWKILQKGENDYFLMSNNILDSYQYASYTYQGESVRTDYNGNSEKVYPNNYKYSDLRVFLNVSFINFAFQKYTTSSIKTSTVDNAHSSIGLSGSSYCEYLCATTYDRVFALSYQEVTDPLYGLLESSSAKINCSDYAKCMGYYETYNNSVWWLRSPSPTMDLGIASKYVSGTSVYESSTSRTDVGVVPAMHISTENIIINN